MLFTTIVPSVMEDKFTAREVAVLVEDLKSEFRAVTEVVAPLPERLSAVEERLIAVEVEVRSLRDVVHLSVFPRLSKLESKTGI